MSQPIRVLLVDDHRMFCDAIRLLLEWEPGVEMAAAVGTAEDALEHCRKTCPDVVLMDVDLPGMTGVQATEEVRRLCPECQVVAISSLQTTEIMADVVAAGASGFIRKTEAADRLTDVIRRAFAGEMVLPAEQAGPILLRLRDARRAPGRELAWLTSREVEILQALTEGKSTSEVAEILFISPHTVRNHVRNIITKLGVRSKLEAVLLALRLGVVSLPE